MKLSIGDSILFSPVTGQTGLLRGTVETKPNRKGQLSVTDENGVRRAIFPSQVVSRTEHVTRTPPAMTRDEEARNEADRAWDQLSDRVDAIEDDDVRRTTWEILALRVASELA